MKQNDILRVGIIGTGWIAEKAYSSTALQPLALPLPGLCGWFALTGEG